MAGPSRPRADMRRSCGEWTNGRPPLDLASRSTTLDHFSFRFTGVAFQNLAGLYFLHRHLRGVRRPPIRGWSGSRRRWRISKDQRRTHLFTLLQRKGDELRYQIRLRRLLGAHRGSGIRGAARREARPPALRRRHPRLSARGLRRRQWLRRATSSFRFAEVPQTPKYSGGLAGTSIRNP